MISKDFYGQAQRKQLPPMVAIMAVYCPDHGSLLPEGFSAPFSMVTDLITNLPFICAKCADLHGEEFAFMEPPIVDWSPCQQPLTQHWSDIGFDPDANPQYYAIWTVRPVECIVNDYEKVLVYRTGNRRLQDDPD